MINSELVNGFDACAVNQLFVLILHLMQVRKC